MFRKFRVVAVAKAGIKVGDVIKAINGKPVTSYADLEGDDSLLKKNTMPGQTIKVTVVRNGEEKPLCTEANEACWHQNRRAETKIKGK